MEDVQVLPISEVVLQWDSAAVLHGSQAQTQTPTSWMELHKLSAEAQDELLLLFKQQGLGILWTVNDEHYLDRADQG